MTSRQHLRSSTLILASLLAVIALLILALLVKGVVSARVRVWHLLQVAVGQDLVTGLAIFSALFAALVARTLLMLQRLCCVSRRRFFCLLVRAGNAFDGRVWAVAFAENAFDEAFAHFGG